MNDIQFSIDENKCIHCGLCIKDCEGNVFEKDENNTPKIRNSEHCISCQHCLAICPVGAISIMGKTPENSELIRPHNPDDLLNLIKSRRSQRLYKDENVSIEKMEKLKNMLKWIPTGCNNHKLHFSFIEDKETMKDFRNYVNDKIKKILSKKIMKPLLNKFSPYVNDLLNGKDIIFREAPHLLVVSSPITAPCAKEDVIIALTYFELYANSLGLGTCWCGFGEITMKIFPELSDYLSIPEGYQAGYVMLFGEKEVEYSRTTQPKEYDITSVQKTDFKKINIIKKLKRFLWNNLR